MMLTLGHILEMLSDYRPTGREAAIRRVVYDSRKAAPGSLFVALQGEKTHGHAFVADAFDRGAIAALVEGDEVEVGERVVQRIDLRHHEVSPAPEPPVCLRVEDSLAALQQLGQAWRERFETRLIGITGSVGKTSTKELAHAVLSQRYRTLKSEHSYNNEIGVPLTLLHLRPEHQRAVLEMGMYVAGDIATLAQWARPQVGVVTNVGPVHLERAGSLEAIIATKRELVEALPPAPEGVAVLNRDEAPVMAMADSTEARIFTYGLDSSAELWADHIISMGLDGIRFTLHHGRESLNVQVPLLGRHSVHTALRAAAVGLVEGLSWPEIITGLQSTEAQLRLVAIPGPKGSTLIDDTYNSSPESALAALKLLADLDGRRVAVLGDMLELGAMAEELHSLVGRRAREVVDVLVAVGRLGRLIGEAALAAGMPQEAVLFAPDGAAATGMLEELVREGDMILVKGSRGARLEEIVSALSRGLDAD